MPTSALARLSRTALSLFRGRRLLGGGGAAVDPEALAALVGSIGQLKGVAMKVGQIFSYIDVALPEELRTALSALQTSSPSMPFDRVTAILKEDLGPRAEVLLVGLEPVPVAAASIGQVHRGVLPDGAQVAVKVRYPDVDEAIVSDFRPAALGTRLASILAPGARVEGMIAEARERFLSECDQPRSAPVRVEDVARCGSRSVVMHLEVGAKGPETSFVTGAFVLNDPLARQILAVLPPVIRMTPETEQGVPSFFENIQFITREVETDRPGSEVVLLRMADVIFIQILRAYLARVPDDGGGFLGALRDPSTAAALGAMHHRAEVPWTVASLAKEVGLSRSVFAARFTQLVGEPPLGYLTRLRMQKAATLLREGATLAKASQLTGYASEASFSHAFRQWAGDAPGVWRRKQPPLA